MAIACSVYGAVRWEGFKCQLMSADLCFISVVGWWFWNDFFISQPPSQQEQQIVNDIQTNLWRCPYIKKTSHIEKFWACPSSNFIPITWPCGWVFYTDLQCKRHLENYGCRLHTGSGARGTGEQKCEHCNYISVMWDLKFSRWWLWRMPSSGMLRHVALVRTDVSEALTSSIIRVTRIGELGATLAITNMYWLLVTANVVRSSPILVTLMIEALSSSETSVLTRATQCNGCLIPEFFHNRRNESFLGRQDCCESLVSCLELTPIAKSLRSW
jgi:hypothetical protein